MKVTFLVRVKTVSEANAHEHWRARQKRAKEQRRIANITARASVPRPPPYPLRIHMVRIAPRGLDGDNLAGSQKHTRDGLADWLGIKDNDPRVEWTYGQEKGPAGATRVEIETMGPEVGGPFGMTCSGAT
jgi:hypothetical protein